MGLDDNFLCHGFLCATTFLAGLAFSVACLGHDGRFLEPPAWRLTFLAATGLAASFLHRHWLRRLPCLARFSLQRGQSWSLPSRCSSPPAVAAALGLPALAACVLGRSLSFLRLGGGRTMRRFRHIPSPFLAVAAGCYSPCVLHQQACFWNTCTTTSCKPFRQRECPDQIDTVVAPFVQALAQSVARAKLPLPSQLFRLCTDCRYTLRSVARQPAGGLAAAALPAIVHRWRRSGTRTLPLSTLPLPRRFPRCPLTG